MSIRSKCERPHDRVACFAACGAFQAVGDQRDDHVELVGRPAYRLAQPLANVDNAATPSVARNAMMRTGTARRKKVLR